MKTEYNAADEKQVQDREKENKNRRDQELEDIRQLIKTPHGVRFLRRIVEEGGLFRTTFTGNSQTFFLEGHRNFALKFFNDICEAAPTRVHEVIISKKEK